MKKFSALSLVAFLFLGILAQAQNNTNSVKMAKKDTLWRKAFQTGLNINQGSFSSNWKGGGVNSFALAAFFKGRAYYENKKLSWDNTLDLEYGDVNTSGIGNRKGNDRIFLDSKYGYSIGKTMGLFGSLNFLSQFAPGYNYTTNSMGNPIAQRQSSFLAPGYFTESLGLDYKPNSWFDIRWGIATLRQTVVSDTSLHQWVPSNYGVAIGKTVRNQVGSDIVATLNKDLAKNLHAKAIFSLFTDYSDPGVMVPRLDLALTSSILKYVNVNFGATVFYDQTQDYKIQSNEVLSVGIVYTFSQFKK